uniref:Uncharacterized protein n=1 Tax=Hyaloperonospora arabidopsidis (strain Emoy2) TaxID=559515 RepID=M4C1I2_HYAAE
MAALPAGGASGESTTEGFDVDSDGKHGSGLDGDLGSLWYYRWVVRYRGGHRIKRSVSSW